jgi:hypothetical protein
MSTESGSKHLLAIYLNDHLAGATGGLELARRVRSSNADDPEFGQPLARICVEIEADRESLKGVMEALGVRRQCLKPAAAWAGEKLGRLKLNGQLRGYSPLSRLLEVELLLLGVTGKLRLWRALRESLGERAGQHDLDELQARAVRQRDRLEELHRGAAARALSESSLAS